MIGMGLEGHYTYTNDHYTQSFSPEGRSFLGQSFDLLLHPEDTGIARDTRMQCMQYPEQLFPFLVRQPNRHGDFMLTQWECQAMVNNSGHIHGVYCVGSHLAACLDEAGYPLLGSNFPRATLPSHEARQPLANLMGLVTIMQQTDNPRQLRSLCSMILASAQQLHAVMQALYKQPEV
ncbi:hypothetical protein DCM91_19685 [Chitinophaga costaii]|nr:hypothetical protein DCM91_19685 [Chitinophaga costaii]